MHFIFYTVGFSKCNKRKIHVTFLILFVLLSQTLYSDVSPLLLQYGMIKLRESRDANFSFPTQLICVNISFQNWDVGDSRHPGELEETLQWE